MYHLAILLFPILLFSSPNWMYNLTNDDKNVIIGYGIDKTLSQAKQNSIADIVKTMSVKVESSINISKSNTNGNFNNNVSKSLRTKANAVISGVKFIKVEQKNQTWYVAAIYDNSPFEIKLKKKLPKNIQNEKQNIYLKDTPLIKRLNDEIAMKLNYKLIRMNNLWQIKYKNIIQPINQQDFYDLFSNQKNSIIRINSNKKNYLENDKLHFKINLKKEGYVSVLYVEHNGKVGVLVSNKKVANTFTFPDLKMQENYRIVNPYGKTIKELYISIYSNNQLDLSEFEDVSGSLLDESNYNFNKLINLLSSVDYATTIIKIKK